jgi:hypothetical protein
LAVAYKTEKRDASSVSVAPCLLAGYGNTCEDVYFGVESLWEIGSSKSKDILSQSYKGKLTQKTRSVQLGARLGYVFRDLEAFLFVRGGFAFSGKNKCRLEKTKFFEYGEIEETPLVLEGETKSGAPFVSAGIEKFVSNQMSVRLEAEALKKRSYAKIQGSSKAKAVRLLFVWNLS